MSLLTLATSGSPTICPNGPGSLVPRAAPWSVYQLRFDRHQTDSDALQSSMFQANSRRLTNNHFQFSATFWNRSVFNGNAHIAVKVGRSRLKHVEWVWNRLDVLELDAVFLCSSRLLSTDRRQKGCNDNPGFHHDDDLEPDRTLFWLLPEYYQSRESCAVLI